MYFTCEADASPTAEVWSAMPDDTAARTSAPPAADRRIRVVFMILLLV